MVATRSVYVRKGKAYVPMSDQINLVMLEFKKYLMKALEATSKLLPRLEEDDRLKPILLNVEKQYIGRNYNEVGSGTGSITAKDVDSVSYILCKGGPQLNHPTVCSSSCAFMYAQSAGFLKS